MTNTELIKEIAADLGKTQKEVKAFIEAIVAKVHAKVGEGEKVTIKDLVTVDSKVRAAREARNPQTGEKVAVPEKTVPVVKAVKALKDAVAK